MEVVQRTQPNVCEGHAAPVDLPLKQLLRESVKDGFEEGHGRCNRPLETQIAVQVEGIPSPNRSTVSDGVGCQIGGRRCGGLHEGERVIVFPLGQVALRAAHRDGDLWGSGRQSEGGDTLRRGSGRGVAKQLGVEGEGGGSGGWVGDRGVPLRLMSGGGVETEGETGNAEVTGVLAQLDAQLDLKSG